jgi:hypothetical protein
MIPGVGVTKRDFQTGVVPPSDTGILAIIATSSAGVANTPAGETDPVQADADFGEGPLLELGCCFMAEAKKPFLGIKSTPTTDGTYGTITPTGTGTATWTGKTGTHPFDAYPVVWKCIAGGTEGTAGIQWQYSLDGGQTFSQTQTQGTSGDFVIPNTGMTFSLGSTTTVVAGDIFVCQTVAPILSTTDIAPSLEALRRFKGEWDAVFIDTAASATIISQVDTWLSALEGVGVFKVAILRTRPRAHDGTETEAQYATAMSTAYSASSSIRLFVGADDCDKVSQSPNLGGYVIPRPAAISIAARVLSTTEEVDPAEVDLGALPNTIIDDANQNPKWHDEAVDPGLDPLRLATLRTFQGPTAPSGVFVNNCPMLSPAGSDYVYIQHARVMNKGCTQSYALLLQRLSKGVRTNPDGTIFELDAKKIDQAITQKLQLSLAGQCTGVKFSVSRTDDLSSNQGSTVNCTLEIASLKYIKKFAVTASFAVAIAA